MKGYYINLDHREDRKTHFENNIKSNDFFKNVERFTAIKGNPGYIGCSKSHIELLTKFLDEDGEYFMVCEDDISIINNKKFENFIIDFNKIKNTNNWDLITLTPYQSDNNIKQNNEMLQSNFMRLKSSQTTACYIIKKSFIKLLLENFKYSTENLIKSNNYPIYAIDQYWKRLFPIHNIYAYKTKFVIQLPGYSDINQCYVNYGI